MSDVPRVLCLPRVGRVLLAESGVAKGSMSSPRHHRICAPLVKARAVMTQAKGSGRVDYHRVSLSACQEEFRQPQQQPQHCAEHLH